MVIRPGFKEISNMGTQVSSKQIRAAKEKLNSLPPKNKVHLPLSDAIVEIQMEIRAALKRGYTYEDITQALREAEIEIKTPTLKSYVAKGKKRTYQKKSTHETVPKPSKIPD